MKRLMFGVAATAVALTASMLGVTTASAVETLVVDDDAQQCGAGTYPTITAALDDAADGDIIEVCPGRYAGGIHVTKSVSILGPLDAVIGLDCLGPTPAQLDDLDLTQVAVIQPLEATTEATEPLVTLDVDNVELAGLVIQGVIDQTPALVDGFTVFTPALTTSDGHSGYRIHHNLIRLNTLGVEFGSSGATSSRFDHNCLRQNRWGLANQRRHLVDAVIDSNATFRTQQFAYEIGWGLAGTSHVTLQANDSTLDNVAYIVENSLATRVADNTVTAPFLRGIDVAGGNEQIRISDNVITGGTAVAANPLGILLRTPSRQVPSRSTGVVVDANTITGIKTATNVGTGIGVARGAATGAQLYDNVLTGNGAAGLSILDLNTDNLVRDNISHDNAGYGIRIQGTSATGNRFEDNHMFRNGLADARDDTDPIATDGINLLSTWTGNRCETDIPAGAICGVE